MGFDLLYKMVLCHERKRWLTFPWDTRSHIAKANSGHRDKAEIESVKEAPILPDGEKESSKAKE